MNIKSFFVTSIVSFYPAIILFLKSPWFDTSTWVSKLVFFAVIIVLVYIAVSRVISVDRNYSVIKHVFEVTALGIGFLSAALAFFTYILPTKGVSASALLSIKSFSSGELFFVLLIVPLVSLLIAVRKYS